MKSNATQMFHVSSIVKNKCCIFHSTLKTIFSETECLVSNIENNREHWMTIKNKAAEKRGSITSLEVFDFIDAEDERENELNGNAVTEAAPTTLSNGSA